MALLIGITLVWLIAGAFAWHHIEMKDGWKKQLSRYTLVALSQEQESTASFWERWQWLQNLVTFLGYEKLRQWAAVGIAALVAFSALLIINGMDWYVSIPLSAISIGLAVYFFYLQQQQKAMDHFRNELPDIIDGLLRAIRVGAPMADTFLEISHQHDGITRRLFERMHDELSVGQALPDVMKYAAKRMPIAEFRFLTIVLSLQQETGGRLTGVLERLSHTLRARAELNASILSITSESRNSAKVLAALPVLVCLVLFTTGKEHFDFLMASTGGQLVMAYVVTSILSGLLLIRRMTQLKG
ncbi:type II secretion system F family protein [Vibrio sp. SCSIO 43132]|uniref:type II secretion system F family protein n=1 Tax=Vibrio sp. SCSIO 43132 TaxID=2779363 RepID=UPI001CAA2581|nr:type II secretion system F family protein [Vibrio sp. SCSIO 43132]UAB70243.1 type II secretion system F family protein [Vibrio sp. SCSIO 43132]